MNEEVKMIPIEQIPRILSKELGTLYELGFGG
jgi:hypothetical protein